MLEALALQLEQRAAQHLLRERHVIDVKSNEFINFASNDYLGLSQHPKLKEAMIAGIKRYGVGSGGSQVVCGYTPAHAKLEETVARFTNRERALIFSTGYLANLAALSALCHDKDNVFIDKNCHASIIDALSLSGANIKRFLHNDGDSLQKMLTKAKAKNCLIVTEGVFSMEGDIAPLPLLLTIAKQYESSIMVDDSHGLGILGDNGQGTLSHYGLSQQDIPILMASFGKSCGSLGAFIAGSHTLVETIMQFSRSFLCSTAMPPALALANKAALDIITEENLSEQLQHLIQYFVSGANERGLALLPSTTAIQPLVLGDALRAKQCHQQLLSQGFLVGVMRPPTVAPNKSRLRISITLHHNKSQIDKLLDVLQQC